MTNDALERLLIDWASGELAPDVAELLEAHLANDLEAMRQATEISGTLNLARMALESSPIKFLPQLEARWIPRRALALAACFIGGIAIGVVVMRGKVVPPRNLSAPVSEAAATPAPSQEGFWSQSRIRAALAHAPQGGETA